MQQFLSTNPFVSYIMVPIRLMLGWIWLTNAWNKISTDFDAAPLLQAMLQQGTMPEWWAWKLENIVIPNAGIFNMLVIIGELLVGIALVLGIFTTFAAYMGLMMNFSFLFTFAAMLDAQLILVTFFVILAGRNAGRIGLDRYLWKWQEQWKQPHMNG